MVTVDVVDPGHADGSSQYVAEEQQDDGGLDDRHEQQLALSYLRDQVAAIARCDPLVRRDEPDAVHQLLGRAARSEATGSLGLLAGHYVTFCSTPANRSPRA